MQKFVIVLSTINPASCRARHAAENSEATMSPQEPAGAPVSYQLYSIRISYTIGRIRTPLHITWSDVKNLVIGLLAALFSFFLKAC